MIIMFRLEVGFISWERDWDVGRGTGINAAERRH